MSLLHCYWEYIRITSLAAPSLTYSAAGIVAGLREE